MQKTMTVLARILVLSLTCAAQLVYSQSITAIAHVAGADIINAGSIFDPMADRIKDLNPSTFSLQLINNTMPKQDVQAVLHIEASATLAEDGIRMQLYILDSQKPFLVPKEGRTFTAQDSRGADDMQFTSQSFDANIQKVKDKVWDPASGGKLPSGKYDIAIKVMVVKVGVQTVTERPVDVTVPPVIVSNPTVASLIMPSEDGYLYPTQFPQFQWTSDTRSVTVTVCEKHPGQSNEDAAQASDAQLKVTIDRAASNGLSIFTYPQANAALPGIVISQGPRPLEQGKTYVLALEGNREAFGSSADPIRTLRSFTIEDSRSRGTIQSYRSVFSGAEYQNIFDLLQNKNLQIDANGITLNNAPITLQQLQIFLNQNRQRKFSTHLEE